MVELYQSEDGTFHYEVRVPFVPRSRLTFCGLNTKKLRHAAWFEPGDPRGLLHFQRACDTCRDGLTA